MTRTQPAQTVSILRAVQAAAVLSVLALLWQFVTAGRMLSGNSALDAHGGGAIALHVTTGLLVVATFLLARTDGAWWPVAVAAAVFVAGFVQAVLGETGNMSAHVPGAFVLVVGTVWLTAWAFRGRTAA